MSANNSLDTSLNQQASNLQASQQQQQDISDQFLGQGWQFPPSFSTANKQVVMTESENNINQSIDLILNTQRGERSLSPDFGSNLRSYLFAIQDATLKGEIAQSVKFALLQNEPRILVEEVNVEFKSDPDGLVAVGVIYTIKTTNTRHNHVFPFSILEGTNLTARQQGVQ